MSPAIVHALRPTKGGPVHLDVFVPGKDRAKVLCREATDAIVAKIDGASVVTRLARCKGSRTKPQGYARRVRVPDKRVVGGMHAAASVLLRRGWCVEVERDADVAPDGVARKFVIGTAWRTVVACEDPSHVRRVVAAGHAPCVRCEVESLYPVPVADETSRVESLVSEAVCSWLRARCEVTSFNDRTDTLTACSYKSAPRGRYTDRVLHKRFKVTRDEFQQAFGAKKKTEDKAA